MRIHLFVFCVLCVLGGTQACDAAPTAPAWMHALVDTRLPQYDEETDAVLLYSEDALTVTPNGSIKRLHRAAYKILRRGGERYGLIRAYYDDQSRITALRAWCIPASGKDYEVKEKDAIESAVIGVDDSQLITDTRTKTLRIPAAVPGSIVGYEYERQLYPYLKSDEWEFQDVVPVREARYSLQLPAGWSYKAFWSNHPQTQPMQPTITDGRVQWTIRDIEPVRIERNMPPWQGIAGRMMVSIVAPNSQDADMQSWRGIGLWYAGLTRPRRASTADIRKQTDDLTAAATTPLQKMHALADFVQNNIRYVAIELGIGGHQPHPAASVLANRFGDCKDKATLLATMLADIGVESHYVVINTERGSITGDTPPTLAFNHAILAIVLPQGLDDASLKSTTRHAKLGTLLFFDPTDHLTPFGQISGPLQENYGLLVTDDGGELIQLPKLPAASNGIERTAQLILDAQGTLTGDFREVWIGDAATEQRYFLRNATQNSDMIKPVESVAATSFTSFDILKASVVNLRTPDTPFEWKFSIEAPNYAKPAADLLLVRPRVFGSKSSGLLETKEPRVHPIEFERPQRDRDIFEIEIPAGYSVEEVPPPIDVDEGFAAYRSKTEVVGKKLRYTRTFEIKELSVPAAKADRLKQLYRTIEGDERRMVALKKE